MDLSLESTLLPDSSKSTSILPKPSTRSPHAPAPTDLEQVSKNPKALTPTGFERSAPSRFSIRSAKSLSLDLGTRSKQRNLRTLLNFFEPQEAGTGTENSRSSQEGALGTPTHKVSMVINRNIPDAWNTSKTEPWLNKPNRAKIIAVEQIRTSYANTREAKLESMDPMRQGDQSEQEKGGRGRSEWRRMNFSTRSKSLDWRSGVSDLGKGERTGIQGFQENFGGFLPRRPESFERDRGGDRGKSVTTLMTKKFDQICITSRIKEYISAEKVESKNLKTVSVDQPLILRRSRPGSLPLDRVSKGQSLPSRIKPILSDSEVEGGVGVWGLYQNGKPRAGDVPSNNSILDRIEKLFGPVASDMSMKRDGGSVDRLKAKRNSAPVEDWPLHWRGDELSQRRSSTSRNPEWGQGGTFPRRYSKGEKEKCETGSNLISRFGNDGGNVSSLRCSNVVRAGSEKSRDRAPGRQQQTQTLLTEKDEIGSRSLDRGRNSQTFSITPRSVISTPKVASPQLQVQSSVDSTAISVRALPQDIQSKAVTDEQEKEREYKGGNEEIKNDVGADLDPGRNEDRNMIQHEGGLWDEDTVMRQERKHEEREENCNKNKEPKSLKATAICERSPTVKYCDTLDPAELFPKMKMASLLQPESPAFEGVNKESKVLADCSEGRTEHTLANDPTLNSSEPSNIRGHKEQGEEHDDVFRLNSSLRVQGNRPDGEFKTGVPSTSLDNVRSKIDQFESLSQQSRSMPPYQLLRSRRALSVPGHHMELSGVKKSDSDRTLDGVRGQGPVDLGPKQYFMREGRGEGGRRNWEIRSLSVDGVQQRRDGRAREDGGISFPQQTKCSDYKKPYHKPTINTEPQRDFKASFDEPDSSMASQPETKQGLGLQDEILKPGTTKDLMPTLQNNSNSSNGTGSVTGITNTTGKNDLINISESDDGGRTCTNSFITSNESDDTSGSTNPDQPSKMGPQISASTRTTEAADTPVSSINGVPYASSTPVPEAAPSHSLPHPATTSSTNDPQLNSGVNQQNQAQRLKESFGVCLARWSSDEDLWGDEDDDDDEGTEKGSNYDSDSGESSVTITSNMSQSDRLSFSVSLADLCHFGGVEYTCPDEDEDMDLDERRSHRTASLSSDISAFSSISLLPAEELDRLVEDVRGLGDETLQNYEDVKVVVLHKEVGCGLGFTVAGGVDQNKPITVHKVFPSGLASQEGSMREGDRVLSINGTALKDSAHWEALRTLRRARSRGMAVVVLQKGGATETMNNAADNSPAQADQHSVKKGVILSFSTAGRMIRVVLNKSSTDLGFSLEGGLGSNMGDRPLTVKKLFQGGPVDDVFPGDELLEIEGQGMQGLRRLEAWNLIKKLPPGPLEVVLNRPFKPQ